MKSKRAIMRTYDAIASDFDITRYKPWPSTIEFAKLFKKGELVLDLGCGNGRDMRHFQSLGIRVAGSDISRGQLQVVRERADAVPLLVQGDVCQLPFRGNIAQGAILVATLHHLTDHDERLLALKEAHRCLAPGGKCLVSGWAREQPKFEPNMARAREELGEQWEPGDMLLDWKLPDGRVFPRYYHLFSKEEFAKLLAASDFLIEKTEFVSDNHYALVTKQKELA